MSDKSFWYTPRDPETRSFRWRVNRDRAAAQEAAEKLAVTRDQWSTAPRRDQYALEDGDTRAHMWVPMVCLTMIGGSAVFLVALVLIALFGGAK